MDETFWFDALRDLGLLLAGGGLTAAGGFLNNRRANTQRAEDRQNAIQDAATDRDRAVVAQLRDQLLSLYIDIRGQQRPRIGDSAQVPRGELLDAENNAALLRDPDLRGPIVGALRSLNGLNVPISHGYLDGPPIQLQMQVLHTALEVLNASARGDAPPKSGLERLKKIGNATRDAWAEEIEGGGAQKA